MLSTIQSTNPWHDDLDSGDGFGEPDDDDLPSIALDRYPPSEYNPDENNTDENTAGELDPDLGIPSIDRNRALASAHLDLSELDQHLFRARDLLPDAAPRTLEDDPDLFPTQLGEPDLLLCGGVARGEMIEIIGRRTSGRFSLVLSTLAAATRRGESAALVDLGDHFDPQVGESCGVDLARLLWLRPRHMKEALGCAELLLGAGFALVTLDLGMPPVPGGRGVEAAWLRLARNAQTHRGALLVSAPYRMSGTAAQAVLELRPGKPRRGRSFRGSYDSSEDSWRRRPLVQWLGSVRAPRLLGGFESELVLQKARAQRLKRATTNSEPGSMRASTSRDRQPSARVVLRSDPGTVALPPLAMPSRTAASEKLEEALLEGASDKAQKNNLNPSSFVTPTLERFRKKHPDSASWSFPPRPRQGRPAPELAKVDRNPVRHAG